MRGVYPDKQGLATTPTPLHLLKRLSKRLGGPNIWVKRDDLTGCIASGNKVRKLEFIFSHIIDEGGDTIITAGGTQSNHCRAVAALGAQLGLNVHLLLRIDDDLERNGNLLIDHLCGAKVSYYSREEFTQLDKLYEHWTDHYRSRGLKPSMIPIGGSDAVGIWGYIAAAEELSEDFKQADIRPSKIIHATGSGGTQAGLIIGSLLHELTVSIEGFAVCDNREYFIDKIRADINAWQQSYGFNVDVMDSQIIVNDSYKGPKYGRASRDVFDTIQCVAAEEGLVLDPVYSGKAFHGMLEELKNGRYEDESDIVFVHTGGIFGLLAQSNQLQFFS